LGRIKILIFCTGNSCHSQMVEGLAREAGWQTFGAGIKPKVEVNTFAMTVMAEIGIDISQHHQRSAKEHLDDNFYIVATVFDNASESCPVFSGKCENIIHRNFIDPVFAVGNNEEKLEVFRKVRDEIREWVKKMNGEYFYFFYRFKQLEYKFINKNSHEPDSREFSFTKDIVSN